MELALRALSCEFGACGFQSGSGDWEIDKRPLRGIPFADFFGLYHYYFYNTRTHESVGLGPKRGMGLACPVPGTFETNEQRGSVYMSIPSSKQGCVDYNLRRRGAPPGYDFWNSFGVDNGSTNCHGYVSEVVSKCLAF